MGRSAARPAPGSGFRSRCGALFANSSASLRQEIKRITGAEVREAAAAVEPAGGTVVKVFTTGTVVRVFLLARGSPVDVLSGSEPAEQA